VAEKTQIAWCDSTMNPWIGCQKVSAGCDNCYAEDMMDTRYHRVEWGQRKTEETAPSVGTRVRTSGAYWRQPLTWNRHYAAFQAKHGHRQRVFCASLADVFDNQVPPEWRHDLFRLIWDTPALDWLLLTKRPENIACMIDDALRPLMGTVFGPWYKIGWLNVWLGITCEDQEAFDRRWPILREIPARVRFISYEPAIGPLQITQDHKSMPDWIICGGESGREYRNMNLAWAARVKEDCALYEIPFFMKQVSGIRPREDQIPSDLKLRQFPVPR